MPSYTPIRELAAPAPRAEGPFLPAPAEAYRPQNLAVDMELGEPGVPLSHYLWILRRHRWRILGFVAATLAATLVLSKRITPIYESTVTVDVDRRIPSGVIGQEATAASLNDSDQFLATQVKLIQSDSVLRPVADQFKLREKEIEAGALDPSAPVTVQDAPVLLQNLKVARPPNTYLLLIGYRSADPHLAAAVANAVARSYLEHTYQIRFQSSESLSSFMEKQLEELKAKMERSSAALAQFEKELNVINPEEKTSILSARLMQLNTEYTNAQTERVRKETAQKSVSSGGLEAAQASSQGEALKRLTERLEDAQLRFADAGNRYGANHPEYKKAAAAVVESERQLKLGLLKAAQRVGVEYADALSREETLGKAVAETKTEFDRVNSRSFEYQALRREADADKKLYEELVTKIKEAGINAGFQNSAIRIADPARPSRKPVFPDLQLNLALAAVLSTLLGVGAAVIADVLDKTVRDPEHLLRTLNTEVVGSLPAAREVRERIPALLTEGGGLALTRSGTPAENNLRGYTEAIRTLRNSILLADFDRRLRSIMVTSASPSEGKSTTAASLAVANAQQGRKTLLVDGDLRRPSVHRRLELTCVTGLSDVLTKGLAWREALVRMESVANLDVLPAGPPSRRAGDVIGGELTRILEEAATEYDLIILDSPPLLGFPEPLQMATSVDGVLVVVRSGQTNRDALSSAIGTLSRLRANVLGIVMNEVRSDSSDGYYYYHSKYYRNYRHSTESA